MNTKNIILLLFIIALRASVFAQTVQEVVIQIYPQDAVLKINGQLINTAEQAVPFTLNLPPGSYPLEIWATGFKIFRDTLLVNDKTRKYAKVLTKRSDLFNQYKAANRSYKNDRIKRIGSTAGLVVAHAGALYLCLRNNKINSLRNRVETLQILHSNLAVPASLEGIRTEYNDANRQFEKERRVVYLKRSVGIPLVLVSGYFSQKLIKKMRANRREKPVLQEDKNPFVFGGLELKTIDATCQIGLNFKF